MSLKPDPVTVIFVRDDRRRSERAQRAIGREHSIDRVYTSWPLLMKQRRKGAGDVVAVTDLWVLADPKQRSMKGGVRNSMMKRVAALRAIGASVWELTTGLSSSDPVQYDAMLAAALDALANSRQHARGKYGRRKADWTREHRLIAQMHWRDHVTHSNDDKALAAMRADGVPSANRKRVAAELGPSGRKPGTTGPRPTRRKRKVKR
jgi:hypothetical protein